MAPVEKHQYEGSERKKDPIFEVKPGSFVTISEFSPAIIVVQCNPQDSAGQIIISGDASHLAVFKFELDVFTHEITGDPVRLNTKEGIIFHGLETILIVWDKDQAIAFRHLNVNEQRVLSRSHKFRDD